jgi:hypothetical protein
MAFSHHLFSAPPNTMASILSKSKSSSQWKQCRRHLASISQRDYLSFDTLHSLNAKAVKKYERNPLFGTFRNDKFEWITYGEFGRRVDMCRGLLRDVGEFAFIGVVSWSGILDSAGVI